MNKKINIPLVLVTICIWGFILYNFADALWLNDKIEGTVADFESDSYVSMKQNTTNKEFEFDYLEKDPFNAKVKNIIESDDKIIPVKTQIIKEEHRIRFLVTGIVINGVNKNIVLNDETNSNVVFLKEGESYQGLKIVRVSKHEVELLHISSGDKIISPLK